MQSDDTTFYWDESTGLYYYWNEELQTYVAWGYEDAKSTRLTNSTGRSQCNENLESARVHHTATTTPSYPFSNISNSHVSVDAEGRKMGNEAPGRRIAELKTAVQRTEEQRLAEREIEEDRIEEQPLAQQKMADRKMAEQKMAEQKMAEQKMSDRKMADLKMPEKQVVGTEKERATKTHPTAQSLIETTGVVKNSLKPSSTVTTKSQDLLKVDAIRGSMQVKPLHACFDESHSVTDESLKTESWDGNQSGSSSDNISEKEGCRVNRETEPSIPVITRTRRSIANLAVKWNTETKEYPAEQSHTEHVNSNRVTSTINHSSSPSADISQQGNFRKVARSLTLAEHGGLRGVLERVRAERKSYSCNDQQIRADMETARLKALLSKAGLLKSEKLSKANAQVKRPESSPSKRTTNFSSVPSGNISINSFSDKAQSELSNEDGSVESVLFRRPSIRFGTADLKDPSKVLELEKMMDKSVNNKTV